MKNITLYEHLSGLIHQSSRFNSSEKLEEIVEILKQATKHKIASETADILLSKAPFQSSATQLESKIIAFKKFVILETPTPQDESAAKSNINFINNFVSLLHDEGFLLEVKKATLLAAIQTDEVQKSLSNIDKCDAKFQQITESSEELLGNINDAKLIAAYTEYKGEWKKDEENAHCHFWISAAAAAVFIIMAIAVLGSVAPKLNLPTTVTSLIMLAVTGFGSFVVAVFSGNFKHARFLRTYYHHLSISTLFYKNFIQDTSIDSAESKAKEVARLKILELASKFPENKFDGSSDEDHIIKGSISEIAKAVRGK